MLEELIHITEKANKPREHSQQLPQPNTLQQYEEEHQVLCINSDLAVDLPEADGLVMEYDVHPSQWVTYDSGQGNDTDDRIFFHETSGHSDLSLRQCCAVESAARHNPDRPIQLFMRSPATCNSDNSPSSLDIPSWLKVLSRYPNVAVVLLNEERYFSGTPLEDWYSKGVWRTSRFQMGHLSDYIRIVSLYKGGGMYLDMDILTLRAFKGAIFRNCLVYENDAMDTIGNSVLHLERGHSLTSELIQLLSEEYDPEAYVYHGPDAIAEIMNRVCNLVAGNPKSNECNNVRLLSHRHFHPVPAMFSHMLFQSNGNLSDVEALFQIKDSFGLHLWNSISLREPINVDNPNQIVAILARRHCPLTVSRAADFKSL
ncbi:lactosylceramide 4-alpha-galactosyltransferase-like isoform X2 [Daphnia carinata]|uniref:lactosylceramide 4-alpha-galactosyltransferase-like isoform X2 n=1 Tax=Daphnia carinata TaxID=120202 RepID=UPI00257D5066|nr:lactosylceramide 4-alpha-galactosyltransferase-like isoform X2 [Daphnia carinata]XP_057368183.1 lactosylceramide 4-alpha-galactosyltransferase-like isoform X2 [Daphnia carinata]